MGLEKEPVQPPKRRGRPPKPKKTGNDGQQLWEQPVLQIHPDQGLADLLDEQLAYTLEEEQISQFSSFLRHILRRDRAEIARVARELDVAENTIYRWMSGNSDPRPIHLKNLLNALPEQRSNLIYAINQTFPGVLDSIAPSLREVQKDIYRRVMELVVTTAEDEARHWQISQAIFEYALLHLDPDRCGLAISYAKLMPEHADGIHSLYEAMMRGNYPWPFMLETQPYLGSTTLAGTAAILQRLQTWDNLDDDKRLQVEVDPFERSACAYPVRRAGRMAGVLVISSTQPGFFANPIACRAVVEYAQLLSLAFHEEEFKAYSKLNLRPMPDLKWQREELSRSCINRIIACARQRGLPRQEAEVYVRREMEVEFEELGRLSQEQQSGR